MKKTLSLSDLPWTVTGFTPQHWRFKPPEAVGDPEGADVPPVPAPVPGSVQQALRNAGILPDWNLGLNVRQCDWVENRDWIYETHLPASWIRPGDRVRLVCLGLDGFGSVRVNHAEVGTFRNAFRPHSFDLTPALRRGSNRLRIVLESPPRWLGQFGRTSEIRDWKPRFNYTWDWVPRLVQVGIWDAVRLEVVRGPHLEELRCTTNANLRVATGSLRVRVQTGSPGRARIRLSLLDGRRTLRREETGAARFPRAGVTWRDLPIRLWQPNGSGPQQRYTLLCQLLDARGREIDRDARTIGFRSVRWKACEGAPAHADPWLCVVNGTPVFLRGVNWTPIRPTFADVPASEIRRRLVLYRDLGFNLLRVWGGAVLERESFYDLCDELGLFVWQEFPLSSSGVDNCPPSDPRVIGELSAVARSYIVRRQHHPSLLLWCGGNELMDGKGKPLTTAHPLLGRFARIVAAEDPGRRYVPASASGPTFIASAKQFGKGLHWDVHGPWSAPAASRRAVRDYWKLDDALFRSETGAPGASPEDIITGYAGDLSPRPFTRRNPFWSRDPFNWSELPAFLKRHRRPPRSVREYVTWSQARQATLLRLAAESCLGRFPRCGGILFWMGHDCFPIPANTSIIDFKGRPKPAALALRDVFRNAAPRPRAATGSDARPWRAGTR